MPAASTAAASIFGEPFDRIAVASPRALRSGKIARALRQRPEIEIAAGERQRPAIFELLGTPELRETIGIGPSGRLIPADGGMRVEKRAIGIEDESAWHGRSLRMRRR